MSTRCNSRIAWPQRTLCVVVSSLALVASVALTAGQASAAPGGGGGGKNTTTTTAPGGTTTTTAPTGKSGVANPKLTAVVSLSRHRALATYDTDLDALALEASNYLIFSTEAVNLPVTAVSRASQNQVFIITGPQEPVTYRMEKPKTPRPITFTGSTLAEPKLLSVRPVSKTQIIVSFSEPVGSSALQTSSYQITVEGSTAALTVNSAALFGSTGKEVMLTTAAQEAVPYVLKVGDIQGTNGTYMDPTATTLQFSGSTVLPGPMLLNATADGNTRVVLTFDSPLDPSSATNPANYTAAPNLFIQTATLQSENRQVVLTTGPQYQVDYTLVANVTGANGNPVNPAFNSVSFKGSGEPINNERPKVTSAASTGNKTVVVQFSKPMADNTADPARYAIVQTKVHPEVGMVGVTKAEFVDSARLSVRLTTMSQAEVTYQVTVNNVTDLMGNPLADKTNVAGAIVDPTSFTFPGTPPAYYCPVAGEPCIDEREDSDGDGLWDHEETRGWEVTIGLANGQTQLREVTSNPFSADTDQDGLKDNEERALNIDPRDFDTDDDGTSGGPFSDYVEFNEFYSDPAKQDSDTDGLYDGLEAMFFATSPLFDDTDGDQMNDGYEINVNRNPKVADLPQPVLKVTESRMGLDVRFIESNGVSSRELDAKSVETALTQSSSQEFGSSESTSHELSAKLGASFGGSVGWEIGLFKAESEWELNWNVSTEVSNTNTWSSEFTQSSTQATEEAHKNSLSTEEEHATDSTVTREVRAATMKLAVSLESRGNVAFTATNLQVAALMPDPADRSKLMPIATLVPDTGVDTAFNLGPLVAPKGPIVFSNDEIYPQLVDQLMNDPSGLVFRFANYDIKDEAGRNFAFTSQEINDRTARIAIDYGGFDADGDGRGEESEILRVATGIMGRNVVDTNIDGAVDGNDRKVVFDTNGKQVGITLRDALTAAGLKHYYEDGDGATPSHTLSLADKRSSYSTMRFDTDNDGDTTDTGGSGEFVYRIRNRQIELNSPKAWEIVSSTGIDRSLTLDDRILYPGSTVSLSFVQDLDKDGLTALTESVNGCLDSSELKDGKYLHRDTDGDQLDDRFEVLIGWEIDTLKNRGNVRSQCSSADSDGDGLADREEAPGVIKYDDAGMVLFDAGVAPYTSENAPRRNSAAAPGSVAAADEDPITDPNGRDTDLDMLEDGFERTPWAISGTNQTLRTTSPEHPDTDNDGLPDGVERQKGADPRLNDKDTFWDSDRDGLTDAQEVLDSNRNLVLEDAEKTAGAGWQVVITEMHKRNALETAICHNGKCPTQPVSEARRQVYSARFDADTDDDGIGDYEESVLKTDPGDPANSKRDSDGDGLRDGLDTDGDDLTDFEEVNGFNLHDGTTVKTKPANLDTDNDKRSDGEEAGLPQYETMVVPVVGKAPYEAHSSPIRADTDLDLLVDGDEQTGVAFLQTGLTGSTDPAGYDTDGDQKSDYSEVWTGFRNPLVPDLDVHVFFNAISVTKDGDDGDDAGDISYQLGVEGTRPSIPAFFGSSPRPVTAGNALYFADWHSNFVENGGVKLHVGSVSTTPAQFEQISIEGWIAEIDESTDCIVRLPGFTATEADGSGSIAGPKLTPGMTPLNLHRKVSCNSGQEFEITLHTTVRAL